MHHAYKVFLFLVKGDVPAWPVAMNFIVLPNGKFTQTQVAS